MRKDNGNIPEGQQFYAWKTVDEDYLLTIMHDGGTGKMFESTTRSAAEFTLPGMVSYAVGFPGDRSISGRSVRREVLMNEVSIQLPSAKILVHEIGVGVTNNTEIESISISYEKDGQLGVDQFFFKDNHKGSDVFHQGAPWPFRTRSASTSELRPYFEGLAEVRPELSRNLQTAIENLQK